MKALALTGVGLGLCGVAALASPLVTLFRAGGRPSQATAAGPHPADDPGAAPQPEAALPGRRPEEGRHRGGTSGPPLFIPAQRTGS